MPRTLVLLPTPLFSHVLQCIRNLNYRQSRTRVALLYCGIYMHVLCMVINNKWQICGFKTAQSWKSVNVSCLYAGTLFLYVTKAGETSSAYKFKRRAVISPPPCSHALVLFIYLPIFPAGKKCWSYRFLCLEFSGDWNARWKRAQNNYKVRSTACFLLSVSGLF